MNEKDENILASRPEQIRYAAILEKGMYLGLLVLLITFVIYVFGIMKPYIPKDKIPTYWTMGVHDYLHHAQIKPGWSWVGMLKYADFLNFIGIAILSGVTTICFVAVIPVFLRNNDRLYAVFASLEAAILCVAASGLLSVGH